jgi:hypothetical protein
LAQGISVAGACASCGVFLWFFDPERDQRLVDALWPLAALFWGVFLKLVGRGPFLGVRPRLRDVWPIGLILPLFAAAWLPFYDNWRWAYTGDSFGVFSAAYWLGENGLRQNLLSVHGIDDSFTYLWEVVYALPMLLFEPTFFWHRVGMLVVACVSLVAIYVFFTLTLGRLWGVAVVLATVTNGVWLWFSYVSYLKIDSFIFSYLTLTLAWIVWQGPDRLGAWALCGLVGGLSLFFTPTAWSGVAFVGLLLAAYTLASRRFLAGTAYAVAFVLAAVPILTEIPWFLEMTQRQANPQFDWSYHWRMFTAIVRMPYDFNYYRLGVQGAFLQWPLGHLYLVGASLTAVALVPPVRRWLRIPAVAAPLLILLVWDAALLSVTNKDYAQPSTKRAYNLIPLQIFFALLPLYVLHAWIRTWRWLRGATIAALLVLIGVYAVENFRLMMFPRPHVYGGNMYDGLIELRQRYPDRRVFVFTSRDGIPRSLAPESHFQLAYGISDNLTIAQDFEMARVDDACARDALVCFEPNFDADRMRPLFERRAPPFRNFSLLNSFELYCYECGENVNG